MSSVPGDPPCGAQVTAWLSSVAGGALQRACVLLLLLLVGAPRGPVVAGGTLLTFLLACLE